MARRETTPRRLRSTSTSRSSSASRDEGALVDRRASWSKSYADLLTELHGEVCTANTGAAARAAAARARWNRPVT